jgi:hypothetical protein
LETEDGRAKSTPFDCRTFGDAFVMRPVFHYDESFGRI